MFYYDGKRWRLYPYKITYTEQVTVFDSDPNPYVNKDNAKVQEVTLSEEQRMRLESVAHVTTMGLDSLVRHVMGEGVPEKASAEFSEAKRAHDERQALKSIVDPDKVPVGQLRKMDILIKPYEVGAYFEKKDVIEYDGDLYTVIKGHEASEGKPPSEARSLYRVRRRK